MDKDVNGLSNSTQEKSDIMPKYADSFRVGFSETEIFLDFGVVSPDEKNTIILVDRVYFSAERVKDLIGVLLNGAIMFEREHDKNIGFHDLLQENRIGEK